MWRGQPYMNQNTVCLVTDRELADVNLTDMQWCGINNGIMAFLADCNIFSTFFVRSSVKNNVSRRSVAHVLREEKV